MQYNESNSSWSLLGSQEFSSVVDFEPYIKLNSQGTPYVVYIDATSYKANVMKYNGVDWEYVGDANFTTDQVYAVDIAFDSNDTPYMSYSEYEMGNASVMKYNGSSWELVGAQNFSAGNAVEIRINIDSDDTPYVVFGDGANNFKATVMKYDGSSWSVVGSAGFSADEVDYLSLEFDSNNTPYIAFNDSSYDFKAVVMKYDGSSWSEVGVTGGISESYAFYIDFALDSSGTPYISYADSANSNYATVMKYDGSSWDEVGTAGFSEGVALYTALTINSEDTPYIVYEDNAHEAKSTVKKFVQSGLSGTPTNDDVGVNDVNLTLSDGTNELTYNFSITVNDINNEPTVTSSAVTSVDEDSAYSYILEANDLDDDSLTWSVTEGTSLPSWLTLSSATSSWEDVGSAGFSTEHIKYTDIVIDGNDTLYVSFLDYDENLKVMEYTESNNSWDTLGTTNIASSENSTPHIALNSSGTPYVIFADGSAMLPKASVMKYNGSDWEYVGDAEISSDMVWNTDIAFDSNDTPYIAYVDDAQTKVTVKKFTGTEWELVGSENFSSGMALELRINIDNDDIPYVVFRDKTNSYKATVMKYDGSSWDVVGSAGFSAGGVNYTNIVFDSNNTPYVTFVDDAYDYKSVVMKYDGSSWSEVGTTGGISDDRGYYTEIAIDSTDTPYLVYEDLANDSKAMVMKYDGTNWVNLGAGGASEGGIAYSAIAIDSEDTPYIIYDDEVNDDKATVRKYIPVELSGTPTNDDVGTHNISLTLSDGTETVEYNFEITVSNVNDAPVLSDISDITIAEVDDTNTSETNTSDGSTNETVDNGDGTSTTSVVNGSDATDETTTSITYPNGTAYEINEDGTDTQITLYDPAVEIVIAENSSLEVNVTNSSDDTTNNVKIASLGADLNISDEKDTIITLPESINSQSNMCDYTIEFDYESDVVTTYQYINKGLDDEIVTTLIMKIPESSVEITDENKVIHTANYINSTSEEFSVVGEVDCLGSIMVATTNVSDNNSTTVEMNLAGATVVIEENGDTSIVNSYTNPDNSEEQIELEIAISGEDGSSNITTTTKDSTTQEIKETTTKEYLLGATFSVDDTGISEIGVEVLQREISVTVDQSTTTTMIDNSIVDDAFSIVKGLLSYIVEIVTTNGAQVTIENYLDTTVKYIFSLDGIESSVSSEIVGTYLDATDTAITMRVDQLNRVDGEDYYQAYITTDSNGVTTPEFRTYNSYGDQIDIQMVNNPSYQGGSTISILQQDDELYIKTITTVNGSIEF